MRLTLCGTVDWNNLTDTACNKIWRARGIIHVCIDLSHPAATHICECGEQHSPQIASIEPISFPIQTLPQQIRMTRRYWQSLGGSYKQPGGRLWPMGTSDIVYVFYAEDEATYHLPWEQQLIIFQRVK